MTREQVHDLMENELRCVQKGNYCDRDCAKCPLVKDDKELIEAYSYVIKTLEQESVLDKISVEIKHFMYDINPNSSESDYACNYILQIIDKYKIESESQVGMTIDEFYSFYKSQLLGKFYCSYKEVENEYHYEREDKGYDHLGWLGYEDVKVVDSYKTIVSRQKINKYNVIDITRKLLNKEGWLENDN